MLKDSVHRLGIACCGFTFDWDTLSFMAHQKIQFNAAILVVIVQLAPHLAKDIGNKILKDGVFVHP